MAIHKSPSFTRAVEANSDIIVLRRDTITGFNPTNLPDEAFIHFSGRDTVGDGGGGLFRFDRDSTATADGGIVFAPTGGGRLLRDGWTANGFTKELSVAFFGSNGNGIADSSGAFSSAYTACPVGGAIKIPPGTYIYSSILDTKFVYWEAEGQPSGGGVWQLPGLVRQGYGAGAIGRIIYVDNKTSGSDYASTEYQRITNHIGGTAGNVSSNLRVTTTVENGATNYEWGFLSVLNNNAASGAGENVAIYGQANKMAGSTGPTWAAVFEARNNNNTAETGGGLVAAELDIFSNGSDTNTNRVGLDVVVGKGDSGGAACQAAYGIRVGAQDNNPANGTFINGIAITANCESGITLSGTNDRGIKIAGTQIVGVSTENATLTNGALRMARGQSIDFEATSTYKLLMDGALAVIRLDNAGAEKVGFILGAAPGVRISGTQVIGARNTGWAPFTGITNKATTYDTSSITLPQLAERVAALQSAFTTHGLIGA